MKFTESDELAGHWNEYYSTTMGELVNFFTFLFAVYRVLGCFFAGFQAFISASPHDKPNFNTD